MSLYSFDGSTRDQTSGSVYAENYSFSEQINTLKTYFQNGQMYSINPTIFTGTIDREQWPIALEKSNDLFNKKAIIDRFKEYIKDKDNATHTQFGSSQIHGDFLTQLQRSWLEQQLPKNRRISQSVATCCQLISDNGPLDQMMKFKP